MKRYLDRLRAFDRKKLLRALKIGGATLLLLSLATAVGVRAWLGRDTTIHVDTSERHQTMAGWEALARMWEYDKANNRFDGSWEAHKTEIFSRLVNELGINRLRIEIRSGAENPVDYWADFEAGRISYKEVWKHFYEKINDNADPQVVNPDGIKFSALDFQVEKMLLPIRELMEKNGEKLIVNLCYVDFKREPAGTLDHAQSPEEYAELIAATFQHLKEKYGIEPDIFEIILEPDNTEHWRGKQIGEGMMAALARLTKLGFHPQVTAPSTASTHLASSYFDELIAVPGVRGVLSTFSYHRYSPKPNLSLPGIAERARANKLQTAMLEHTTGGQRELVEDLTLAGVSAWQQYQIAHPAPAPPERARTPYVLWDSKRPEGERAFLAEDARMLAHFFRPVRVGAVRVGATTDNSLKQPVAFVNPDGTHVLVVSANRGGTITIDGLPPGNYRAEYSTNDVSRAALPDVVLASGGSTSLRMPDSGVLSLVQRRSARTPG